MNSRYLTALLGIALLGLLCAACVPVPTPSVPTSTLVAIETPPPPTLTSTVEPSATSTLTSIPSPLPPTPTPPPPPLVEIFPQVNGGEKFVFINNNGELSDRFVPSPNCIHSGAYGLQLMYNMKGAGNGVWGVRWINAPSKHFDASAFSALTFWVKGTYGGETFQIGLKDTNGHEYKVESSTLLIVSSDWMQAIAPLNGFKGVNIASIENINFGFNKNHGTGSICIDDIAFFTP